MRVLVTQLKAPWPVGTKPGDVVEVEGDGIPGWAFGKCEALPAKPEPVLVVNPEPKPKKARGA
jgi:hypothetical protein